MIKYKNYNININYNNDEEVYYPVIYIDNQEIYDGEDVEGWESEAEAIASAKEFIDNIN